MPIPSRLLERIATFRAHLDSYLSPDYKEARLREEFLNPLFEELGWDIANRHGYAEAYKDVVHEDALKISGVGTVAPDFSFRIGGNRKFFVEAKKPAVRVKDDPEPAAQLRRYSFTAGLPLGIVTDFHEFAIYDGRVRWRAGDKASTTRLFYCTFEELPEHWDFIAGIFSRDAVLRGGFDKYAATTKGKRGTSEFDDEFLKDMEHWRELLARNIALRNTVAQRDLNFAVQRILDRIVFLRIAEDRGIERFGQLQALTAGPRVYPRFCDLCRHADLRYNSGLFHFEPEKGRDESPDRLTLDLEIDDAVLKEILAALYYPRSPYAFAVVPADVLGHVYEQFLGKVIHLTSEHRVKVEEKPEVRKAGGVYYTPTYIVSYIVAQTLGPLLDGRTPKQAEKLRVLDPACGSGSFLLGAFDYLLDWHLKYYLAHDPESWAKKKNPPIYETAPNARFVVAASASEPTPPARNWQLTTAERKRILLNNLHGVDIDTQAVEVTKLSLLLKVLEGQARELQGKQLDFHRVLPDLGKNIKCGNSLIGSDFYAQKNLPTLDDEARLQINAFDWPHEFQDIMTAGGFDAVIGNPPYLAGREWGEDLHAQRPYLAAHYSCFTDQYDLFAIFMQRSIELLNTGGCYGAITPNTWLNNEHYLALREWLSKSTQPSSLNDFRSLRVFKDATVLPIVFCCNRASKVNEKAAIAVRKFTTEKVYAEHFSSLEIWRTFPGLVFNLLLRSEDVPILKKVETNSVSLGSLAQVKFGVKVYQKGKGRPKQSGEEAPQRLFEAERKVSADFFPYLWGSHVRLWEIDRTPAWLRYGEHLAEPRTFELFEGPRVLVRRIVGDRLVLCPTAKTAVADQLLHTVKPTADAPSYFFIAAILQSRLLAYFFRTRFNRNEKTFPEIRVAELASLPIRVGNRQSDRAMHDTLIAQVEHMLKLHEQLAAAQSPHEQTHLQRDIAATDRAIDQLVYQLYGLTPEEIALIESATAPAAPKPVTDADTPPPLPAPAAYNAQAEADAAHHYLAKEDPPAPLKL